jgi:hypothetical protein
MTHGFDINSPLVCEGIVGDGCGGGRLFVLEDEVLFAYDPTTHEKIILLRELKGVHSISKKGCDIFIQKENEVICFNLSLLQIIS